MRLRTGLGLAVAVLVASAPMNAQFGGILKKKAGEIVGKKAPAPTPAPTSPATGAETPKPTTPPGAAPAPADSRGTAKKSASPLDISELDLPRKAKSVLRDVDVLDSGEWTSLPYIDALAVASARALDEAAQVTLVQTVGAALRTLVMSDAFAAEHDAYIKDEHHGVNHGITGLVSTEAMMKRGDQKGWTARLQRDQLVVTVDTLLTMPPESVKTLFDDSMKEWTRYAAQPTRSDRAKFQKLVAQGQALAPLASTDVEKFRRGYATLKVSENDGPATEEAVSAAYTRAKQEAEQLAWDEHNLKGQLKRHLATFIAIAPTVDYAAATQQKGDNTVFVNPAYEKKGAIWKACFRAGKGPATAALQLARAWVKEL